MLLIGYHCRCLIHRNVQYTSAYCREPRGCQQSVSQILEACQHRIESNHSEEVGIAPTIREVLGFEAIGRLQRRLCTRCSMSSLRRPYLDGGASTRTLRLANDALTTSGHSTKPLIASLENLVDTRHRLRASHGSNHRAIGCEYRSTRSMQHRHVQARSVGSARSAITE